MSELTNALQKIFSWLKNYPRFEQSFKPGLSYQEIKRNNDKLGSYYFTSELYELYQYRNGTLYEFEEEIIQVDGSFYRIDRGYPEPLDGGKMLGNSDIDPFLVLHFCPMDYITFTKYEEDCESYDRFAILEIFLLGTEAGDELVCPEKYKINVSSLMSSITQYVHEDVYPSLTAKFLDLADSIEADAYFFSETEYGKVLSIDTEKICRQRKITKNSDVSEDYLDLGEWTSRDRLMDL